MDAYSIKPDGAGPSAGRANIGVVEPAVISMRLSPPATAALDEVLARANSGPNPAITAATADGRVRFTCDTYRPMLAARLSDAFRAELGERWLLDVEPLD